ncbi:MAG: rubredoxin [Bacilli bacterium]|jgi:rubredoxin|nr:rubredoxin [Bacilli bacterium]
MEEEKKIHHFQCNVCGYVYETTEETLPADFICPECGATADQFSKLD